MNASLEDIAIEVAQEIDSISQRMSFLHILPFNNIPTRIDEAGQHDTQARDFVNLLQEIIIYDINDDLNEKSREILGDLIVKALKLVSSSPNLQNLLEKEGSMPHAIQGDEQDVKILNDYLSKVAKVGCRNISISHQQDTFNSSILFRTIEKCNTILNPQKVKIQTALCERREELNRGQNLALTLSRDAEKKLQETKDMVFRQSELEEEEVDAELGGLVIKQERNMKELLLEFEHLQCKLFEARNAHLSAQQVLVEKLKVLEEKKDEIQQEHLANDKRSQNFIYTIEALWKNEKEERRNLEHKYALVEANRDIEEKEKCLLQNVLAMEAEANLILFHAATALQKIFRGSRDRYFVLRLKKKTKKKKKGKKKVKGKGKQERTLQKGKT
jgi:hypothetical protein